jgi:hypothetical protein
MKIYNKRECKRKLNRAKEEKCKITRRVSAVEKKEVSSHRMRRNKGRAITQIAANTREMKSGKRILTCKRVSIGICWESLEMVTISHKRSGCVCVVVCVCVKKHNRYSSFLSQSSSNSIHN